MGINYDLHCTFYYDRLLFYTLVLFSRLANTRNWYQLVSEPSLGSLPDHLPHIIRYPQFCAVNESANHGFVVRSRMTKAETNSPLEQPNFSSEKIRPGSSVGIANDYGLDGPGSNPGEDEIFRPSRPALGPTQPPVKWVPALSRG